MDLPVHFIGNKGQGGTYLLRIHLQNEINLVFGGFQGGKRLAIAQGDYIYVGSALNPNGSTSLAARLLRHASRSGEQPPHLIREPMHQKFLEVGLGSKRMVPPKSKKLHWNVDHLLDRLEAELVGIIVVRNPIRLETEIGHWVVSDPSTEIVVPGLGANDVRGGTHLLRVLGGEAWWRSLVEWVGDIYGPRFPVAAEYAKKANIMKK